MSATSHTYDAQLGETWWIGNDGSWRGQFRRPTGEVDDFSIENDGSAAEKGFPDLKMGRGTVWFDVRQNKPQGGEARIADYWLDMRDGKYFATWKEAA